MTVRPLTPAMRRLLFVASGLVLLAGIPLFVFPTRTDRLFAWTIQPPLTAAFLGASYWASFVLEFAAARRATWADARVAVPGVFVFTSLTLVATLIHLERFHFDDAPVLAEIVAWAWLAIYVTVPVVMLAILIGTARRVGDDPPRVAPAASWFRVVLAVEAAGLSGLGVALLAAPEDTLGVWPWQLTPLTARAVGAWLVGLGVVAGHAAFEGDHVRMRPAMHADVTLCVLQAMAVIRDAGTVDWGETSAWVYAAVLATLLATGIYGVVSPTAGAASERDARPPRPAPAGTGAGP